MHRPLHIALVDDDRVYQFTTERMLQRIDDGIAFRWFRDGEEALTFLKEHASDAVALPDVMILDINMPFMDGWQFLEAFRGLRPTLAKPIDIFMVSSSADERDQLRALATGDVADYLEKPITSDVLRELVARYGESDSTLH